MRFYYFILFIFLLFSSIKLKATETFYFIDSVGTRIDSCSYSNLTASLENQSINNHRPNPILQLIKKKQQKNKKTVAAILAFPFPFGFVGLHRIYLGTAPYVPVVYVGTLGGALGILPFIDFCYLLFNKDLEKFQNNKKIFMWIN